MLRCTVTASLVRPRPAKPKQTVPTGFVVDTLVSTGLTAPNDFCFLPDGHCSAKGYALIAQTLEKTLRDEKGV